MNRRQFFGKVGISSLTLPFVKFFKKSEFDNIISHNAQGLESKWAFSSHWVSTAKSSCITTNCPYCHKYKFMIPAIWHPVKDPLQVRFWLIRNICKLCNKSYLIQIKFLDVPNYFNVQYFVD